jgi:peptide/nickel transport system substrate-binding protein
LPSNPFDPARARALLAAAGYSSSANGAGRHLHFDFYTSEKPERELSARALQRLWAPFGVSLRIHYASVGGPHGLLASYGEGGILARRHFDIAEISLGGYVEPEYLQLWFDPNQVPNEAQPAGANFIGAQNVRLLEYLSQARRANDVAQRRRLYDQAQHLIVDNAYWIPLYAPYVFVWVQPTLGNFKPADQSPYENAFEWYRTVAR